MHDYSAAAIVLMLMVVEFTLVWLGSRVDKMEGKKTPLQDLNKVYQFVSVNTHRMFKNLGSAIKPKPDALPALEVAAATAWLMIEPRIMEFTQSKWIAILRDNGVSVSPSDWARLMARWQAENIVKQKDENAKGGKGRAMIAARDETYIRIRMQSKVMHSPASDGSTPKIGK